MGVAGASSLQKSGASAQVVFCCLVPWNPRCLAWEGLGIGRTQDRRIKAPPGCAGNRKRVPRVLPGDDKWIWDLFTLPDALTRDLRCALIFLCEAHGRPMTSRFGLA
jgi:hypothetical protein